VMQVLKQIDIATMTDGMWVLRVLRSSGTRIFAFGREVTYGFSSMFRFDETYSWTALRQMLASLPLHANIRRKLQTTLWKLRYTNINKTKVLEVSIPAKLCRHVCPTPKVSQRAEIVYRNNGVFRREAWL